jgi:uncharacterized membrane protein HdeD (DUF308 family)
VTILLTIADLMIALVLFWHSADSPNRAPVHRAMLYAFAFATMCFGAARFLVLFGANREEWQWMIDLGHASLVIFAMIWVVRETGLKAKLEGEQS